MGDEKIIRYVRQQSAAGWFMGAVVFYPDNVECYDKAEETCYFDDEESLAKSYRHSINMAEACAKAKHRGWINWNWERE